MTALKIEGKPTASAMAALAPHVRRLYDRPGIRVMAVVELEHTERMQPAPNADKDASVTMRISAVEVPTLEQEEAIREVQRALYLERTATGTLDEEGTLLLSKQTLKDAGGIVTHLALARLSAGVQHWRAYAARVNSNANLTVGELRREVDAIRDGLDAVLGRLGDGEEA